ncbi:hypothetical protein RZS08_15745, partial [Arthrospira platensis SPKY1]|nr:hypothetical protein [Arthrospira platensis SPKY1]
GTFKFFTTGWGGMQMMGRTLFSAVAVLLLAISIQLVQRDRRSLAFTGWLVFMTGAAFFVILIGQLNTPFFGLTFFILLMLSSLAAFRFSLTSLKPRTASWLCGVVFAGVFIWNSSQFRTFVQYPVFHEGKRVFSIAHKEHGIISPILDALIQNT